MVNYSIIIPHKNIPHLLQRCLDSILRRGDVQIIVVDDNSDADIVDFSHFPGLNDPYIEVIFGKNENGRKGAGYARNLGLKQAKGKWLVFADADDFFMPCFNKVLDKYKDDDENDIIYFYVTSANSDTLEPGTRHQYIVDILEDVQRTNDIDKLYGLVCPHGCFRKRSLVEKNNIQFQEIFSGNDILFSIQFINICKKISIDKNIIYCITERENSLTKQKSMISLKTRFCAMCDGWFYLQKYKKYFYWWKMNIYSVWDSIYDIDKKEAFKLFPRMIRIYGIRFCLKIFLIEKNILGFGKPVYLLYRKWKN